MAAIIQINDTYKIEIDELNKTLFRKVIRTKRNTEPKETYEAWEVIGYYNNYETIFKKILDIFIIEKISNKKTNEVNELLKAIINSNQEIKNLINKFETKCEKSHVPNKETKKAMREAKEL